MSTEQTKPLPKFYLSDIERFWEKVDKTQGQGPNGDCWLWTAAKSNRGYGVIEFPPRESVRAHRLAYAIQHGQDPYPHLVLHKCDTPGCVRGEHLFIGDHLLNGQDKAVKGRAASGDRNGARLYPERLLRGTAHHNAKLNDEIVREMRNRFAAGETCTALAKQFGVAITTVVRVIRGDGWAQAGGPTHPDLMTVCGERHACASLTEEQVREVRKKRAEGRSYHSLAAEYGVTYMPIYALCNGKTWKHVK